jgi:hypothetical protein
VSGTDNDNDGNPPPLLPEADRCAATTPTGGVGDFGCSLRREHDQGPSPTEHEAWALPEAGVYEGEAELLTWWPGIILCDYCDAKATMLVVAGEDRRDERRFTCDDQAHGMAARERVAPLPGRTRFEGLDLELIGASLPVDVTSNPVDVAG